MSVFEEGYLARRWVLEKLSCLPDIKAVLVKDFVEALGDGDSLNKRLAICVLENNVRNRTFDARWIPLVEFLVEEEHKNDATLIENGDDLLLQARIEGVMRHVRPAGSGSEPDWVGFREAYLFLFKESVRRQSRPAARAAQELMDLFQAEEEDRQQRTQEALERHPRDALLDRLLALVQRAKLGLPRPFLDVVDADASAGLCSFLEDSSGGKVPQLEQESEPEPEPQPEPGMEATPPAPADASQGAPAESLPEREAVAHASSEFEAEQQEEQEVANSGGGGTPSRAARESTQGAQARASSEVDGGTPPGRRNAGEPGDVVADQVGQLRGGRRTRVTSRAREMADEGEALPAASGWTGDVSSERDEQTSSDEGDMKRADQIRAQRRGRREVEGDQEEEEEGEEEEEEEGEHESREGMSPAAAAAAGRVRESRVRGEDGARGRVQVLQQQQQHQWQEQHGDDGEGQEEEEEEQGGVGKGGEQCAECGKAGPQVACRMCAAGHHRRCMAWLDIRRPKKSAQEGKLRRLGTCRKCTLMVKQELDPLGPCKLASEDELELQQRRRQRQKSTKSKDVEQVTMQQQQHQQGAVSHRLPRKLPAAAAEAAPTTRERRSPAEAPPAAAPTTSGGASGGSTRPTSRPKKLASKESPGGAESEDRKGAAKGRGDGGGRRRGGDREEVERRRRAEPRQKQQQQQQQPSPLKGRSGSRGLEEGAGAPVQRTLEPELDRTDARNCDGEAGAGAGAGAMAGAGAAAGGAGPPDGRGESPVKRAQKRRELGARAVGSDDDREHASEPGGGLQNGGTRRAEKRPSLRKETRPADEEVPRGRGDAKRGGARALTKEQLPRVTGTVDGRPATGSTHRAGADVGAAAAAGVAVEGRHPGGKEGKRGRPDAPGVASGVSAEYPMAADVIRGGGQQQGGQEGRGKRQQADIWTYTSKEELENEAEEEESRPEGRRRHKSPGVEAEPMPAPPKEGRKRVREEDASAPLGVQGRGSPHAKQKQQRQSDGSSGMVRGRQHEMEGSEEERTEEEVEVGEDGHYEVCQECRRASGGEWGDLLCCDGCPRAVHKKCAGLAADEDTPPGEWFCTKCAIRNVQKSLRSAQKTSPFVQEMLHVMDAAANRKTREAEEEEEEEYEGVFGGVARRHGEEQRHVPQDEAEEEEEEEADDLVEGAGRQSSVPSATLKRHVSPKAKSPEQREQGQGQRVGRDRNSHRLQETELEAKTPHGDASPAQTTREPGSREDRRHDGRAPPQYFELDDEDEEEDDDDELEVLKYNGPRRAARATPDVIFLGTSGIAHLGVNKGKLKVAERDDEDEDEEASWSSEGRGMEGVQGQGRGRGWDHGSDRRAAADAAGGGAGGSSSRARAAAAVETESEADRYGQGGGEEGEREGIPDDAAAATAAEHAQAREPRGEEDEDEDEDWLGGAAPPRYRHRLHSSDEERAAMKQRRGSAPGHSRMQDSDNGGPAVQGEQGAARAQARMHAHAQAQGGVSDLSEDGEQGETEQAAGGQRARGTAEEDISWRPPTAAHHMFGSSGFSGRQRRKTVRWTDGEEAALRAGVRKFSDSGNMWKLILEYGKGRFNEHRTAVDLKDKWRNMQKYGRC
eukprot:jgi/Mesen1/2051/ME000150S01141